MKKTVLLLWILTSVFISGAWAATDPKSGTESTTEGGVSPAPARKYWGAINLEPFYLYENYGLGGKIDLFISDRISVGPEFISYQHVKDKARNGETQVAANEFYRSYTEFALGSTIMITGGISSSGFYVRPAVGQQNETYSRDAATDTAGTSRTNFFKITAGYQWITTKDFRLAAGLGGKILQSADDLVTSDEQGRELRRESPSSGAVDLDIGFVF